MKEYENIYFIGIGGIGMSSLARYFNQQGKNVAGYDKADTPLTNTLIKEGIDIHYEDFKNEIPAPFTNNKTTLVIYTPAIPNDLGELCFFKENGYTLKKRAEVLGLITNQLPTIAVAGTHGKTTTSCLLTHIFNQSDIKTNAFLGGISSNLNSNYQGSVDAKYNIIEADEFDRSFLHLNPKYSIITTTDADHLDIYSDNESFQEGFKLFAAQIDIDGLLVKHETVKIKHRNTLDYSTQIDSDFYASNLRVEEGAFLFDLKTEKFKWENIEIGIPGIHNVENALACIAICLEIGLSEEVIKKGLKSFKGVKRRFEYHIKNEHQVYIDDYAHHPTEIKALIESIRLMYPDKKITAIFQPHLFSRTKDFFNQFIEELSKVDELFMMPIYPAREKPIEGITSEALMKEINSNGKILSHQDIDNHFNVNNIELLLTIGAGDIDKIIPKLKSKYIN